jgi:hypothetical protein
MDQTSSLFNKILASLIAIVYVITYLYLVINSGKFNIIFAIMHSSFAVTCSLVLYTIAATNGWWINKTIFSLYYITSTIINLGLQIYLFKYCTSYIVVVTEIICILSVFLGGLLLNYCISLPFQIIQSFFNDVDMYNSENYNKKQNEYNEKLNKKK